MRASLVLSICAALSAGLSIPVADASEALSAKGGCALCHAVDKKGIGPSYKDIAAKRKAEPDAAKLLTSRVRAGSKGEWGKVPMMAVPPARISDADLSAVVAWILKQ
jgi:cytochrome c